MRKGQMGTKQEVLEVQSQIKSLAAELGWTQVRLAQILYTELNEWDDDDEILKFQERLKKELQRSTIKINRLKKYLEIVVSHPEAQKLDVIFNKYVPQNAISSSLSKEMGKVSKEIDNVYNKALYQTNRRARG